MKISDIITETTAGAVATVAVPLGGIRKRPNPSVFAKKKKKTNEGEERSIIADAAVEHLVDVMSANTDIMDREALEQTIYSELSSLDVEEVVDLVIETVAHESFDLIESLSKNIVKKIVSQFHEQNLNINEIKATVHKPDTILKSKTKDISVSYFEKLR